jgi:hypothetical protein
MKVYEIENLFAMAVFHLQCIPNFFPMYALLLRSLYSLTSNV